MLEDDSCSGAQGRQTSQEAVSILQVGERNKNLLVPDISLNKSNQKLGKEWANLRGIETGSLGDLRPWRILRMGTIDWMWLSLGKNTGVRV